MPHKARLMVPFRRSNGTAISPVTATITCHPGLEAILSSELQALDMTHKVIKYGAQLKNPTNEDIFKCNLLLGSASNILLPVGEPFRARGMAELRRKTALLPWPRTLKSNARLEARVTTRKSKLRHTKGIEGRVVAGVYEALGFDIPEIRTTLEHPPEISDDSPVVRLYVSIDRDEVQIFVFATNSPLHRRGYRLKTGKAPLREDLAFALLYGSGWKFPSYPDKESHEPFELFLDPMCGSGTIAIEAASIVARLPPGRLRLPPLRGTLLENDEHHQAILDAVMSQAKDTPQKIVAASDRDAGAVETTIQNAERAGVKDWMDVQHHSLSSHPFWADDSRCTSNANKSLLVATNPPFGRRISPLSSTKKDISGKDKNELLPLYQTLHQLSSKREQTHLSVFTNRTDLIHFAGWKCDEIYRSMHGGIPVAAVSCQTSPLK